MLAKRKIKFVQDVQQPTLTELAIAEKFRKQKARKKIFRWFCAISAIVIVLWGISPLGQFMIKGTDSIDGVLFFVVKGADVKHGDLAAFYPPKNRYYPDGQWFGKYVAGMAGDEVTVEGRDFYINGRYIGTAKETSRTGDVLVMSNPGIIPEDYYFMWTAHERSYDSRYEEINLIHKSNIAGKMYRIF